MPARACRSTWSSLRMAPRVRAYVIPRGPNSPACAAKRPAARRTRSDLSTDSARLSGRTAWQLHGGSHASLSVDGAGAGRAATAPSRRGDHAGTRWSNGPSGPSDCEQRRDTAGSGRRTRRAGASVLRVASRRGISRDESGTWRAALPDPTFEYFSARVSFSTADFEASRRSTACHKTHTRTTSCKECLRR